MTEALLAKHDLPGELPLAERERFVRETYKKLLTIKTWDQVEAIIRQQHTGDGSDPAVRIQRALRRAQYYETNNTISIADYLITVLARTERENYPIRQFGEKHDAVLTQALLAFAQN